MVVQLDVKEAFDHVEQSSVQSDETTKFEPFFDGTHRGDMGRKLHDSAMCSDEVREHWSRQSTSP